MLGLGALGVEHEVEQGRAAPGIDLAQQRVELDISSPGALPSSAYARRALRSWLISAAALKPRPTTSPMTSPSEPRGSMNASYQSPPSGAEAAGQ